MTRCYDVRRYGDDFILYYRNLPLIIGTLAKKAKVHDIYRLTVIKTYDTKELCTIYSFLREFCGNQALKGYIMHPFRYDEDCDLLVTLVNPFWELVFCTGNVGGNAVNH